MMSIFKVVNQPEEEIKSKIENLLKDSNKMILAYMNEADEPVQSLMLYVIDDEFNIYFGTLKRFPKYEALVANPPLSIVVLERKEEPEVAVSLKATIVDVMDDKETIMRKLAWFSEQNSCKYHIKDQEDFVLFKAKILSARLIDGAGNGIIRYDLNTIQDF